MQAETVVFQTATKPARNPLAASLERPMNERVIKIKSYTDIESLKTFILRKLNLIDHKKNSVEEFDNRLKNYFDRNQSLKIILQFNRANLKKEIRFNMSFTKGPVLPYSDNFEMGNPLNRWLFETIPRTSDEIQKEEFDFERSYKDKLKTLYNFLDNLQLLTNQHICIKSIEN